MIFQEWFNRDKEDVPEKFHSFMSGKAFDHCMICNKFLLEPGTRYMIEKAVKKYPEFNTFDIIFEFAICEDCGKTMRNDLSRESLRNIENYFLQNANRSIDIDQLKKGKRVSEIFTQKCIIKDIEESELHEYQIIAYCDGPHLSLNEPPLLLSEIAAGEIQQLISDKTRDELNNFSDDFLGLPPELKEVFKDEFILI